MINLNRILLGNLRPLVEPYLGLKLLRQIMACGGVHCIRNSLTVKFRTF